MFQWMLVSQNVFCSSQLENLNNISHLLFSFRFKFLTRLEIYSLVQQSILKQLTFEMFAHGLTKSIMQWS